MFLCCMKLWTFSVGPSASAQEPSSFGRVERWTDGNTEEKWNELLRERYRENLTFSLSTLSYILCCWQILALPYLLLIRYEAVSSTPVMGLEMVALRSCEARDMIYPNIDTHIHRCVCLCAWLAASHQPASQLWPTIPQHTKPQKKNWNILTIPNG